MTALAFTTYDWAILSAYICLLALAGYAASRRKLASSHEYFLASRHAPTWLVAVSVLSTVQSAATFLGVPDNSFRGNYTYIASTIGALIGAWVVARVLIPRFYAIGASTVYELLEQRFSVTARKAAAGMYLVGRIFASGARLYLAAIAVSMIVFLDVEAQHIFIAAFALLILGIAFTLLGGLNAVIWSDLVQVILYLGAAIMVLAFLLYRIPAPLPDIIDGLRYAPDGSNKLKMFDGSLNLTAPFSMAAALTGLVLINAANSGLDQDTTQRLLACRNSAQGSRVLYASVWASIPVILIFLIIGSLLHVFYERPDLMGKTSSAVTQSFQGEKISVFMAFILSEIPPGLRGLVVVGVLAAAAINSGLISMSAVFIGDFYRPWKVNSGQTDEAHFVFAGRLAVVLIGFLLFLMSILCFYWQRYSDLPLLDFALSVMAFAYSGLLGVYITALFTKRGSTASVIAALVIGFLTILMFQSYIVDLTGLPDVLKTVAFPWQLCAGTLVATLVCLAGGKKRG